MAHVHEDDVGFRQRIAAFAAHDAARQGPFFDPGRAHGKQVPGRIRPGLAGRHPEVVGQFAADHDRDIPKQQRTPDIEGANRAEQLDVQAEVFDLLAGEELVEGLAALALLEQIEDGQANDEDRAVAEVG